MVREGALPDRCVVCNAQAGIRVPRTLYWSPASWRFFSAITPIALLGGGPLLGVPALTLLFWPAVILLGILHYVVRRKVKVDLGVCERHRRQRDILRGLSIAAMVGMVLVFLNWSTSDATLYSLLAAVVAIIGLASLQGRVGAQAVSLKKLDTDYAWLSGTGKDFRDALPGLPGA
jgi:hypothetical protein